MLYGLTDMGRSFSRQVGLDPGPSHRESLEHRFWVWKTGAFFERKGYEVTKEHPIKGNGAVDVLAERPGEKVIVEVETGKSNVKANLAKLKGAAFDRVVLLATSPAAVQACQKAMEGAAKAEGPPIEILTWLDLV